jgi:phage tail-like protein
MARIADSDPLDKFRFHVYETTPTMGTDNKIVVAKDKDGNPISDESAPINVAVAGFHDFQMPKLNNNKITYREGDNPNIHSVSPGLTTFEDITLSKGITNTANSWFWQWVNLVHAGGDTTSVFDFTTDNKHYEPNLEFRKHLDVVMLDRTGTMVRRWRIYNCFPVNFVPGSDLNASEDGDKSMESLTLCYESFKEIAANGTSENLKI